MTWSTQHVDSLPSGVRALPRGLRSAWVGAASAARAAGAPAKDARSTGDAVVETITRGLTEIGLSPAALESWNDAASSSNPLVKLLQHDGLEGACASLVSKGGAAIGPADDQDAAPWLLDQLGRRLSATDGGPPDEGIDGAQGPDPTADTSKTLLDCFRERFRATVAAGALAASTLLGGHTDAAGRTWRTDRFALDLDVKSRTAVDKAIERAEAGGHQDLRDAAEKLRADGFDDYITPEGYLRVRVKAARDGVQQYSDGVNVWGELRPEPEVFADKSIKSWDYKPFTNDHPPDFVSIANWHEYAVGVVGAAKRVLGADGRHYVEVDIVVADLATLIAIRDGKLELSAGYTARLRRETGRDAHGDEYQYVQFDIWINHLSLVDRGRAGPLARISLDGFAWQVTPTADAVGTHSDKQDTTMTTQTDTQIKVQLADGIEVEMTKDQADAWKKAEAQRIADATEAAKRQAATEIADASKPTFDALQAQLNGLESKIGDLTTAKAETDAKLISLEAENHRLKDEADKRVRAEVIDTVKSVCPKLELDKLPKPKDDKGEELPEVPLADIKAACVVDLAPHFKSAIDGYRGNGAEPFAKFVDSLFDAEVARARKHPTSVRAVNDAPTPSRARVVDLNEARRQAIHGKPKTA